MPFSLRVATNSMDIIDTTKLLSPAERPLFEALAAKNGLAPADLAELAIKQALYSHLRFATPVRTLRRKPHNRQEAIPA